MIGQFQTDPPYGSWAMAAHTIQEAVDAAADGDEIVVTNGLYNTGGRVVSEALTNRLVVTVPVTIRSVNGPKVTVIQGYQAPGTTNGDSAIRCVCLAEGVLLAGFTLTNGATRSAGDEATEQSGGGVWCDSLGAVVSNCVIAGNTAQCYGGGAYGGSLNNCLLMGNSAIGLTPWGGGADSCALDRCTLTRNSALGVQGRGGAASRSVVNRCLLATNTAINGGGSYLGTLNNCTLAGNVASISGGGAYGTGSTLNNCLLAGNSVSGSGTGGGAYQANLNNCTLTGNSAGRSGGASGGALNNCTIVSNSARMGTGGTGSPSVTNCIIYYNTAPNSPNTGSPLSFCCTTPLPTEGTGNITNEPLFVDRRNGNLRLQSNSPCINVGVNASAAGPTDLDGRPRVVGGTVDIGAYEYQGAGMGEFIGWLQRYGLPTDGSADYSDPDADGLNNWQEWQADTDPTNATSCLCLTALCGAPSASVSFASSSNRLYTLLCCSNLTATLSNPTWHLVPGQSDVPGTGGCLILIDTNPPIPAFYRVSVRLP
jgi:hypothetical protein